MVGPAGTATLVGGGIAAMDAVILEKLIVHAVPLQAYVAVGLVRGPPKRRNSGQPARTRARAGALVASSRLVTAFPIPFTTQMRGQGRGCGKGAGRQRGKGRGTVIPVSAHSNSAGLA